MHAHRENNAIETLNHYQLLEISREADGDAIHKAYIKLAWTYHPGRPGGSHKMFIAIKAAHDLLQSPLDRRDYDRTLPPEEKTGSASSSNSGSTDTASSKGETSSDGKTDTTATGATEGETGGTKGGSNAGFATMETAPHPKSERKDDPQHFDNHRHHYNYGPEYTFDRTYSFSQRRYPAKYARLHAMHAANANAPRPVFRRARHRLHGLSLGH